MRRVVIFSLLILQALVFSQAVEAFWGGKGFSFFGTKAEELTPENGEIRIPLERINDGKAHHFKVRAADGLDVVFFTLKSRDGVIRAAIDACDVCYRSGKGYVQSGDYMVCLNCGQRFASHLINVRKGGCNPAPLARRMEGGHLVIAMSDINENSWYMKYRR